MEVPCKYKLKGPKTFLSKAEYKFMKILLYHFFPKLKYALVYELSGPIPGYKPMDL